jgi:NAD(P)-dependent dehydrogenase (short-subunit alcohol dehydrogenase family)
MTTTTNDLDRSTTGQTTTALVTGANKGLGLETARQLAARGWTVWLGARDPELGRPAAEKLAAEGADVRFVQLDVTSDASVAAAVDSVEAATSTLDVLVNNAGIGGTLALPEDTGPEDFLGVYGVNLLGPVRVTKAFLPLLRRSGQPRIVMVSSGLGSFAVTTDPSRHESTLHNLVYTSSKAALNMVTSQYARSLTGFQVTAVDPGYTATDLNHHQGTQTVEEGAEAIVAAATLAQGAPTGEFRSTAGIVGW